MENIEGIETTIDYGGDIAIDPYWKFWLQHDRDAIFVCQRYTKAGLVELKDSNGKPAYLPKRNCNALNIDRGAR